MGSSNLVKVSIAKESSYGVPPSAVKASLIVQDLTFQAVLAGAPGDEITIKYEDTATAGSETVTVSGTDIVIGIEDGVTTATQLKAAFDAESDATDLATCTISGTAGDAQVLVSETPLDGGAGEFKQARFISESYSGTPDTVESEQIRTDRMSSGQVVTGLTVGGTHSFELAREEALDMFLESAMLNPWDSVAQITRALTINATAKTITAVTGSFIADGLKKGDFVQLSGFTASGNNRIVMLTIVTDLVLTYVGPEGMVDGTGVTTKYQRLDKLEIGITKQSLSIEKRFLDLTNKTLNYKGMLANTFDLSVEFGQLIKGSFGFSGNDYDAEDAAADALTYQRYVEDPATTQTFNGSVDMPFVATDASGSFASDAFCIQKLDLSLNNNLSPQNCIGNIAPENYTPGQAQISVSLSSYLKDANWDFLSRKLSQSPFGVGFVVENAGGAYAFFMPAIQVSFDDPASAGGNQDVSMDMSGQAKVGANGESALTIFRSVAS